MAPIRSKMAIIMDEMEMPTFNEINNTRNTYTEPDSLNVAVPLSVIYGIIFIMGVLGNITTCNVIRKNRLMHTATNFFIICLAISDLLLLICGLPLEVYRLWAPFSYPLEESSCITVGLITETSTNATVLTIAAFTVERYIVICHPLISHNLFKLIRVVKYIIAIWICSLCFALPQVMQLGIVISEENGNMLSACAVKGQGVHDVFVISSFVFFVAPMSLIIVLYVLIGIKMHTSRVLRPPHISFLEYFEQYIYERRYRNEASERKVNKMLVAVTISYILCWTPFHVQKLLAIYGSNLDSTNTFYKVYVFLKYLSGVLYYVSAAINPILYSIMSKKFRNAFKVTLSSWGSRRGISRLDSTYSSIILANLRARAAERALQDSRHPPLQRTQSTTFSQQYDAPSPQKQSPNRDNLSIIYEENESELSSTTPQISISNLRYIDQELSCEELTTYLYHVNFETTRKFSDSYV